MILLPQAVWTIFHRGVDHARNVATAPRPSRALPERVVFCGFGGARDGQPQVADFQAQCLPGDPQQKRGLAEIATRVLQDTGQQ